MQTISSQATLVTCTCREAPCAELIVLPVWLSACRHIKRSKRHSPGSAASGGSSDADRDDGGSNFGDDDGSGSDSSGSEEVRQQHRVPHS